MAHRAEV